MKKILAILCGVTMMFAACTPNEDGAGVVPTFPEEQNYEILSGRAQKLVFSAEYDWTLSVDYDFAYLKDSEGNNVDSCSGTAGENIEVFVAVESAIENYDNDIVFHVNMEMEGHTSVLATLTIKKLEYAVQEYEIESGASRRLQFRATEAWTVSMEDNDNAWLEYDSEKGYSFSGTATNELVTIWVKTEAGIKNYDNDIVFSVNRKMGNADAQEWAKFTIKKLERPAPIVLNDTSFDTITFEEGGYPQYGPEANTDAPKYHLNYSDKWDLEGVSMSYNFDTDVAIKWYAYRDGGSDAVDFTERTDSWVTVSKFGTNNFKVVMDLTKESAEWSWWDTQYESFVTFEDEFGNVLAAIFCTSTYKPGNTGGGAGEAKVSFVNPDVAAQVGMSLTGSGNTYTLTFASPMSFDPMNASMCGFQIDGGGQQANFQDGGWGVLNVVKYEDETLGTYFHVCPLDMSTFNPYNLTVRNYTIDAFSSNWEPYTINVVLDWVVEADANALVKLCMPEMAPQCGVSLTGSGNEYVYTFYDYSALFDPDTYSPYCGLVIANATSVTIAGGDYFAIQKGVNYSDEEYYYVTLVNPQTFNPNELTQTEFPITAQLADGTVVTVTLTFANGNGGVGGGPELR